MHRRALMRSNEQVEGRADGTFARSRDAYRRVPSNDWLGRTSGSSTDSMPRPPLSKCLMARPQICHSDSPRRERHKTRPNTARPTASAGTKVTTRLPSGVDHDTAPAVTKAAIRPLAIATRGNFGCER